MLKTLPIKSIEDIEQIKRMYREEKLYSDLLLFLLIINTGLRISDVFDIRVYQIKDKKYIPIEKGITFYLTDEMCELVNIVTNGKYSNEYVFARSAAVKTSRQSYYLKFKHICAKLSLYNISVDSWRRTFGYHHYQRYHDLFFLQWYFGQNNAEQALEYIDVHEQMGARFKQGLEL